MTNYPIIEQRSLPKAQRGGPWGLGTRSRPADQIPLPNAHETVVYKSGGGYVVDDGRSRLDDDHVRNATNISVVDMRANAPVPVHLPIPAMGGAEFNVQVTFLCTVRKPEDVVEAGLHDIEEPLLHYLKQHQPLFHVGEGYELDEINELRRDVTAQVKAYSSVLPPQFPGMDVSVGSVEVLTPEEHAEFERLRRERRREGVLSSEGQRQVHTLTQERDQLKQARDVERQRFDHELQAQQELNARQLTEFRNQLAEEMELQKRKHEQQMTELRQAMDHQFEHRQLTHDQGIQRETLVHDQRQQETSFEHGQRLRSAAFASAIEEAGRLREAIGADASEMPGLIVAGQGGATMSETADKLAAEREHKRQIEADDALRKEAWAREDAMREKSWGREDAQYQRQADREDAQFQFQFKLKELQAQADIYSAGIARGLFDHKDIEKIMGVLSGAVNELGKASDADQEASAAVGATAGGTPKPADRTVIDAEVVPDRGDPDRGDPDSYGSYGGDSAFREEDHER